MSNNMAHLGTIFFMSGDQGDTPLLTNATVFLFEILLWRNKSFQFILFDLSKGITVNKPLFRMRNINCESIPPGVATSAVSQDRQPTRGTADRGKSAVAKKVFSEVHHSVLFHCCHLCFIFHNTTAGMKEVPKADTETMTSYSNRLH